MALDSTLRARLGNHLDGFQRLPAQDEALRAAAVAVIITAGPDGEPAFLLTRRAQDLRAHPGQWALPGGRPEEGETAVRVALRETEEEIGLSLQESAVLGALDDYPTRSGYRITPIVLWCGARPVLRPNPAEVAGVYEIPVAALGAPEVPMLTEIPESDRPVISVPLPMVGTNVHAPTAAILYQFWEVAFEGRHTRVAHYEQPVFAWR